MAFEELKERHAAMWGAGPFEKIAPTLAEMHDALIESVDGGPGDRWLDLGCGTGELVFRATRTGADLRGADLAPNLVETARRQAAELGHDIPFEVADAENLPYGDASFDVVTSSVGMIFAPTHERVAAEVARVLRPEGRLAFSAWTVDGSIGDFFKLIGSYSPPPPEGAGVAIAWGTRDHVTALLADDFDLAFESRTAPWHGESAEALWDEIAESFGPIVVLLRMLDAETAARFRSEMIELFERLSTTDEGITVDRPYLLTRGVRR